MDHPLPCLSCPATGIGPRGHGGKSARSLTGWGRQTRAEFLMLPRIWSVARPMTSTAPPLHDDTMAKAQEVDAVLLGAVGGPKYDVLDFSVKTPNAACCACARKWTFTPTLRPAQCFDALSDFSSLKGKRSWPVWTS